MGAEQCYSRNDEERLSITEEQLEEVKLEKTEEEHVEEANADASPEDIPKVENEVVVTTNRSNTILNKLQGGNFEHSPLRHLKGLLSPTVTNTLKINNINNISQSNGVMNSPNNTPTPTNGVGPSLNASASNSVSQTNNVNASPTNNHHNESSFFEMKDATDHQAIQEPKFGEVSVAKELPTSENLNNQYSLQSSQSPPQNAYPPLNSLVQENNEVLTDPFADITSLHVQVYVEALDVVYKLIDDFGAFFSPYIEVSLPEGKTEVIKHNDFDQDKLNNSSFEDREANSSFIGGELSPIKNVKSKHSVFVFNSGKNFHVSRNGLFMEAKFVVKNEKNKNYTTQKDCSVIMGECHIPLSLLYTSETKKNNIVEVQLVMKLRNLSELGNLSVIFAFSKEPFKSTNEALQAKYQNKNIPNYELSPLNVILLIFNPREHSLK